MREAAPALPVTLTRAPPGLAPHATPPALAAHGQPIKLLSPTTIRASALQAHNLRVYDPGYANTLAYTSSITLVNGPKALLHHRGYPIATLASQVEYLELAHLLIYGELPSIRQLTAFRTVLFPPTDPPLPPAVLAVIAAFPPSAHPMAILVAALAAMGAAHPELNPAVRGASLYEASHPREHATRLVLGGMPALAAAILRHVRGAAPLAPAPAPAHSSFAAHFLRHTGVAALSQAHAHALEKLLLLHADHEQNCSTATMRQLTSAGTDVFSALSGATAALYGPLHGGATEGVLRMLERVGTPEKVPAFLARVKRREERLMGFGHRVYRNYDPRARIARDVAHEVLAGTAEPEPLMDVAAALEAAALKDEYFQERKLYPNVDFYTGLSYRAMGFPTSFFPVLFALGRCAGWLAHWREFLDDPDRRIARPHQRYVGPVGPRVVEPLATRLDAPRASALSPSAKL